MCKNFDYQFRPTTALNSLITKVVQNTLYIWRKDYQRNNLTNIFVLLALIYLGEPSVEQIRLEMLQIRILRGSLIYTTFGFCNPYVYR